jgi:Flp pilus assembly pilin Flp
LGTAIARLEEQMKKFLDRLISEEKGQDLIEYALLLAFVALSSAALFIGAGDSVQGIWSGGNVTLSKANAAIGSQRPPHSDND